MAEGITFHIPLELAITPKDGKCICNRWWSVHPDKGIAFYAVLHGYCSSEEPSPQCNLLESTSRVVTKKLLPDHGVIFVPVVFLAHAHRKMIQLKKENKQND